MVNLLEETMEALVERGFSFRDVRWVGSRDGKYVAEWETFAAIANREYDDGYGASEVAEDLVVVGDDWWLERYVYDGSEWWAFKRLPIRTDVERNPLSKVFGYDTVDALHKL